MLRKSDPHEKRTEASLPRHCAISARRSVTTAEASHALAKTAAPIRFHPEFPGPQFTPGDRGQARQSTEPGP